MAASHIHLNNKPHPEKHVPVIEWWSAADSLDMPSAAAVHGPLSCFEWIGAIIPEKIESLPWLPHPGKHHAMANGLDHLHG